VLLAIASAVAAVVGGAALALAGAGPRVIAPLRAFALAAVIATVLGHLLPEAVAGRGAIVLIAFAAALVAPGVIARLAAHEGHEHGHASFATELAYVSLLLHKLTDGVALGAALAPGQPRHWDVIAAIAAHTVPMAAVVALAYRARPREAWLRALGLAAAIAIGAALADAAAVTVMEGMSPWLAAIASGLLLHVVTHDLPAAGARTTADRAFELCALAAGLALPIAFGAEAHGAGQAALAIARACAPPVLAGLAIGAAARALADRPGAGALAIATLPGCACTAVPRAIELRRAGVALGACVALAIAAPALGADALLLSASLFGAPLAIVQVVATAALGQLARAAVGDGAPARASPPHADDLLHGSTAHKAITALDELVTHGAPWLAAGIAAAALLAISGARFEELSPFAVVAIALALAAPARLSLTAAIPPALALVAGGFPAGAAIAALAIARGLDPDVLALIRREAGAPRALAVVAIALAIAAAVTVAPVAPRAPLVLPRALDDACLAALALLAVRSLWRTGVAAWVAALHGHGQHGRTHDETHAHTVAPSSPHADHHGEHHEH
jgi:uncharacterized membrane protein YraQ (UPF0718 family)